MKDIEGFKKFFEAACIKYSFIPPNKNSVDTRDLLEMSRIISNGYCFNFDKYGLFISLFKIRE